MSTSTGHIVIQAATRSETGGPALGSIVRLDVEIRDASGASVLSLLTTPAAQPDGTFRLDVDAPVGDWQDVAVLAIGDRTVTGSPHGPDPGIGVIYRGAIPAVNVRAGSTTTSTVTLTPFVPQFQPLETVASGVRVSWTPESGVQAYLLTRFYDDIGQTTTTVAGTSFIDDTGASRYQVMAVELSGRRSAPSDFLEGR